MPRCSSRSGYAQARACCQAAKGGWWALAGFSFQSALYLLRFFQGLQDGVKSPAELAKTELLSDILVPKDGTFTLIHCTVFGNTALSFPGIVINSNQSLTLENSIVAGHGGADIVSFGTVTANGDVPK